LGESSVHFEMTLLDGDGSGPAVCLQLILPCKSYARQDLSVSDQRDHAGFLINILTLGTGFRSLNYLVKIRIHVIYQFHYTTP